MKTFFEIMNTMKEPLEDSYIPNDLYLELFSIQSLEEYFNNYNNVHVLKINDYLIFYCSEKRPIKIHISNLPKCYK